ncbi:putative hydrolase [Dioscorea sansibarensis]
MQASLLLLLLLLLLVATFFTPSVSLNETDNLSTIKSLCQTIPYPKSCFDSLKLSISININPSILSVLLQTLNTAISESTMLSSLLSHSSTGIIEHQKGSLQDCQELHQITLTYLKKSSSIIKSNSDKLSDVRSHLSAALTNKATCLEGLATASGPSKQVLVSSLISTYAHVTNSLSIISKPTAGAGKKGRKLSGELPKWLTPKDRRLLQSDNDYNNEYDPASVLTVAADGTGNFTTISDAIAFAPNYSDYRTMIIVRAGVYDEHVEIPSYKPNIVLLGEGSDVTIITGNRSVADGWTTFRSATVAASGQGFLARDLTIMNTAGPAKNQAVALRVNADLSAVYRCKIDGYQDTLYVHSFRQFYRECDIFGTVDFVLGNSAVIFQGCNLVAKKPLPGQYNVITAQSRDDPNEVTGISIQNCSVLASDDLSPNIQGGTKTYLGRPWSIYSTTVYIESYIDSLVDPLGWEMWSSGDQGLDTLYYGEYENFGPGSSTDHRVNWPGYHIMDYDDAFNFTVSEFIYGDEWLDSTSFPYDDGV